MVADVVGYSRLVAEDEAHALAQVRSLRRQVVEPRVTAHAGRPFAALGDGFLAEFPSAVEAVACAVSVQRELSIGTLSSLGLTLRIGIAIGDVMVDATGDVFGDSVNVAARLQTLAEPGGIAISGKTFDELRGRLPYPFADRGQQTLKNIPAPVSMFTLNAAAIGELSVPTAITSQRRPPRIAGFALTVGLVVVGLAAGTAWWVITPPTARPSEPTSDALLQPPGPAEPSPVAAKPIIAVLPLANLSRETRWDRLCDGLSEDIITDLARHRDLLVVARNSTFAYKGRDPDPREVGRALGARYVLEGSLQADAQRLRVTTQLIDARSGTHLWAGRYDRPESDLFVVQDDVVNHVLGAIAGYGGAVMRAELQLAKRRPPASLQAYELYLLGYEQEARLDREGTLKAIDLEEAAVRLDPQLSRAWTVLGWVWGSSASNDWVPDVAGARARAREAIRNAAALDPDDGIAMLELGSLLASEGDVAGAKLALEHALVVGANQADTLALLARQVAGVLGREQEALALIRRAFILNPQAPDWYSLHYAYVTYHAQQFELTLDANRRGPKTRGGRLFQILALAQLGRTEEAQAAMLAFRQDFPKFRGSDYAARMPLLADGVRSRFLDGVRKAGLDE